MNSLRNRHCIVWSLFALGIVITLANRAIAEAEDPCPPPGQCWTTQDVIDEHVDSHAQSVMMGMMERGGEEAVDASSMLCAAKRGEIAGIYIAETATPIARAKSVGSNWWEMIPTGKNWACYRRPPEPPPMIVFRRSIQDQKPILAAALLEAWLECGTISVARCYMTTLHRPPASEPTQPGQSESETVGLEVIVIKQGEAGTMMAAVGAGVSVISETASLSGTTGDDGRAYFDPLTPGHYSILVSITDPLREDCPDHQGYQVILDEPDNIYKLNSHFLCVQSETAE